MGREGWEWGWGLAAWVCSGLLPGFYLIFVFTRTSRHLADATVCPALCGFPWDYPEALVLDPQRASTGDLNLAEGAIWLTM